MSFPSIDALRQALGGTPQRSPDYVAKMLHEVPDAVVIDRVKFVVGRCEGKVVLDVGASGALHDAIVAVAKRVYGIAKPPDGWSDVLGGTNAGPGEFMHYMDLDDVTAELPRFDGVEVVVCGEVVEHLGNSLHFLKRLRSAYPGVPVIVTVPNAFSDIGRRHLERDGTENVHREHCCYFSWRTMKTLAGMAGYDIKEFYWQGGRPLFAEGLVFVLGERGNP